MRFTTYIFILFFHLTSQFAVAQSLETDRPDQTESSSTIPKSQLQIETGILLSYFGEGENQHRQLLAPTSLFRIGLAQYAELRILSQYENNKNHFQSDGNGGISDLEIGVKIQLLQKPDVGTDIALLSHIILPTGSTDLTLDSYGSINKLCISHDVSGFALGYNVGYNYIESKQGDFTYSLALGFDITKKVSVYIEPYGEVINFEDHKASFDAGITFLYKNQLQFDFSFGTGINYIMNYVSVGVSGLIR